MKATLHLRDLVISEDIRPLNLTVPAGTTTALVAPAEVGTALGRVLVGLAPPLAGRVIVGDNDVTDRPPGRRHIGYVPAGGGLLPQLTVRENVRYGQRLQRVSGLNATRLDHFLAAFELTTVQHQRPDPLTPAERFRAALARAAVSLPEALVVDRPEALDCAAVLHTMLPRMALPDAPQIPVLVCTTDPSALSGTSGRVTIEPAPPEPPTRPAERGWARIRRWWAGWGQG